MSWGRRCPSKLLMRLGVAYVQDRTCIALGHLEAVKQRMLSWRLDPGGRTICSHPCQRPGQAEVYWLGCSTPDTHMSDASNRDLCLWLSTIVSPSLRVQRPIRSIFYCLQFRKEAPIDISPRSATDWLAIVSFISRREHRSFSRCMHQRKDESCTDRV